MSLEGDLKRNAINLSGRDKIIAQIPDLGLTKQEYDALQKGLEKLNRVPNETLEWDAKLPDAIGLVQAAFYTQEDHVSSRKRSSRRKFLVGGLAALGVGITSSVVYKSDDLSLVISNWEKARQLKVDEESKRQLNEKIAHDQYLESERVLGLRPTTLSKSKWRAFYPPFNPATYYVEQDNPVIFTVENGGHLTWSDIGLGGSSETMYTDIYVSDFIRQSDGVAVPKIDIRRDDKSIDEWLIRNTSTPDMDINVVGLEWLGGKSPLRKYLDIQRDQSAKGINFQIKSLKPVIVLPRK